MKKLFTSFFQIKSIILLLFFSLVVANAQTYTKTILTSGGPFSALTKDNSGNIYTIKATSATTASVYKYASGATTGTVIYTGLTRDGITYPWGLAVSSSGNVYVSTSFDKDISKIIKLTVSGTTYTASDFQTANNYYTGLTIDKSDNLYALQYDSTAKKYKIVKYSNITTANSVGTDVYNKIDSDVGLSYPTNLAINSDGEFYYNEPFSVDGSNAKKGGITKIKSSNSSVLSSNSYATAVSIDENDNVYTLEGNGSNSDYKINKYPKGSTTSTSVSVNGTTTLAKSSDFIYPYGVVFTNNTGYYLDGDDGTLGGSLVKLTLNNVAPTFTNLNGDAVAWPGVGNYVNLDSGGNVNVKDADFEALNNGQGNWKGATLKVQRTGTAITNDSFWFNNSSFTIRENSIQAHGGTFATFTIENGVLEINFTSSGTIATTNLVNEVVKGISYRNDEPAGDASIQFTLNDGFATANAVVAVNSDLIYVNTIIDTSIINLSNGVSFSEAIAIAAADLTGTQTIVFSNSINGEIILAGNLAINESLNISVSSGNITLSGAEISIANATNTTFLVNSTGILEIKSVLTGFGSVTKNGTGNLKLSGNNSYSGSTSVNAGSFSTTNNLAGNINVSSGATLEAQGTIKGNVTVQGNLIVGGNTTGILNINGMLSFSPSSNFYTRINNGISDVINTNGSSLMGNLVVTSTNYSPVLGNQFTFIKNTTPIIGTFNNYLEGSFYTINGKKFKVSYKSGTGNDFTMTYQDYSTIWENNEWSNGSPDNTKDAILRQQYNQNITANTLSFETNVTVPTGIVYTITNGVINQGNHNIVFEDGAYLVQISNVSNTGNISFKRNSKPIYRLETMDWSSPVLGQNIFQLSPGTLQSRFYHFEELTNNWVNDITPTSTFTPAEYVAFRSPNTFNNYGEGAAKVFEGTFTGVPNNGTVSKLGTKNNFGNNAVGNPYPSPIDLNKFFDSNQHVTKIFVWTHSNPIINGIYNGNNWIVNTKGMGWNDPAITNNVIGVGQGFIAQVTNASPIQFTNAMRVVSPQTISYKNNVEDDKFWLSLVNDSNVMNSTLIGYKEGSTLDYDNDFDAAPMEEFSGIYSTIQDKYMSIQGRGAQFDSKDQVKLGLKFNSPANYTIKLAKTSGLFSTGQSIYLKDNELNKITDLTKEDYLFIGDKGEFKNRFEIVYENKTLGTNENSTDTGSIIYSTNQQIHIKANDTIETVKVFDLSGQIIKTINSVNDKNLTFSVLKESKIVVVLVELKNGQHISKKVIIK
ncbi:autotransporter-associated beta strand repeat-containing protein [Algoriella sp.]|uniref:autotransporter-associated beta strand repeat-containing protein n=2 Tax=Algoriella sp. TaxID=1872434 RepID=UPI002FCC7689